ncbi:MAG: bifunctional 4-hydroxy-3-methylbut-2-enyl diphosphate reductase/30S ribosomal protein S1 [Clostridiales Family XIII bacterium]|jgi:4-hydroxy-3-methylbut-2-enyl diphosphate reductase|nr:bifunctional 4-hydroxy-3-methylbut-2-enyl diphosphate reductase/30S ribosomal protein S1 [Clostridiales Family XIII bacterium]
MEIIKADHLGYCFGVKNAVETARAAIENGRCAGSPVYVCGPIIHNASVVRELENLGLITVNHIEEVPFGAIAVVRSHGEGQFFFEQAKDKGVHVVDATCPRVRHIQKLAEDAVRRGETVVIVGDAGHPEVIGVSGWCGGKAKIVSSVADAQAFAAAADQNGETLFVVAQTTFDEDKFRQIEPIFTRIGSATVRNTICEATKDRQQACAKLAENVEIMLVVGDKSSSNTRKLFEISEKRCRNTIFVENINDLPLQKIRNCNTIGITAGASTPERLIKEVITRMSEFNNESQEFNPMIVFMYEIDKALRLPRNVDIFTGEVIQVSDKDVIINIGCKKDGIIPRNEVTLEPEQTLFDVFKEGDEVQAKVLKNDDGDGNILLSKKRVIVSEHWEDINKALDEHETLEVTVIKEVNGGVIASFNEINGFIPMSQLSDRYVEKADEFVGKTLVVKIMRVDQKRNKVVFSHKAVLNEERQKRMLEIWDTINVGDIIEGKVMRFTDYGAFVDIGGIDGLLHISEISWGKLRHPEEVLAIDQEINVKVLSMNKEKEKISLGYKQNLPEPWSVINEKYQIGQVISGKAVQLKDYGVFVELEPGLDGLVHISEIAYRRVNNISDEIEVGQDITAKILEIDKDRKRISLSIKETLDKEAEEAKESLGEIVKDALGDVAEKIEAVAEGIAEKVEDAVEQFVEDITGKEESEELEDSASVADAELEIPDPEAEAAETAEEATTAFEPVADAELEIPDPEAEASETAEEAATAFEPVADAELEIPDPEAEAAASEEEVKEAFTEE